MIRRILALAVPVLALAAFGLTACSSSDSDPTGPSFTVPFKFAGNWTVTSTMTDNDEGWNRAHPEGSTYVHILKISQDGNTITLTDEDGHFNTAYRPFVGIGDPAKGTFTATYRAGSCVTVTYTAQAIADNKMTFTLDGTECPNPPDFPTGKQMHAEGTGIR